MNIIDGFDFFPLTFDDHGKLASREEFDGLLERAKTGAVTDVIFIAHGFRNDVGDATRLYTTFLKNVRAHLGRPEFAAVATRHCAVAGVFWPSKPFKEDFDTHPAGTRGLDHDPSTLGAARAQLEDLKEHDASASQRPKLEKAIQLLPTLEGNAKAQDQFVELVLSSLLDDSSLDKTEGLPQVRHQPGSEVLARLSPSPVGGTRGIGDVFGAIAGGVGQFLNLTTWYVMKDRAGVVGAAGVADAVRTLHARQPAVRIHLVGHSLGGRLMAACAKALGESPTVQVDSLMLLEAAFSHFGFSPDNGHGTAGFFRDVIVNKVVKGPFVSTFSAQDTVVGKAYSITSRLAGDSSREIGDASDEFGGIGRNGPLKTTEVATSPLQAAGRPYVYKNDIINNLDGSGGLIKDHGDVANEAVTYAFASALSRT